VYFHPLNFIRFVLAVGVLLFHFGLNYYPFNLPWLKTLIQHSSFRVSFFFFISGFVMSLVYGRNFLSLKPGYFYTKRLTRILPVYWLAFILTLCGLFFLKGDAPKGLNIVLHFFGLQCWHPGYVLDLNFTAWSISVELAFYAVFPFLVKWMMKLEPKKLFYALLFIWILQSVQHIVFVEYLADGSKIMSEFIDAFPVWHLGTFIFGMATARFIALDVFPSWFKNNALVLLLFGLFVFLYIIYVPNPILKYIHNGLLAPVFAMLVLALYYDTSVVSRFLSKKQVSALGDLSYGLFIFQYPVWIVFTWACSENFIKTSAFFAIYFIATLSFSWVINRLFERPMLLWLRENYSN
jgi:peptidoglycan/LPS O-acetylase OafA/YrhL